MASGRYCCQNTSELRANCVLPTDFRIDKKGCAINTDTVICADSWFSMWMHIILFFCLFVANLKMLC